MKKYLLKTVIAGIFMSLLFNFASAQQFIFQSVPTAKPQFGLRILRPIYEDDDGLSIISGIYDLSLSLPVSSSMTFVGSIPFISINQKGSNFKYSKSGIGNIYAGFQTRLGSTSERSSIISIGLFLPTASEEKWLSNVIGAFTNFHELHKYLPNILTFYGNFAYHRVLSNGAMFGVEAGPNFWISTNHNFNDWQFFSGMYQEFYFHYGITAGFHLNKLAISTELVGIAIIIEDDDKTSDRFYHSLIFGAQWTGSIVRPGVFYKIYLKEDMRDAIDGVFGLKLDTSL